MIPTLVLTLTLATQNPCEGPPSSACEGALAHMAITWEQKYHTERLSHIDTMATCAEVVTPPAEAPAPVFDWLTAAIAGTGGIGLGILAGLLLR